MKEKKRFLEAGKIINTHGVRGEVRIDPWCDSPEFFCGLKRLYINGAEVRLLSARPHGAFVIASLEGVDDIDAAIKMKNRLVFLDRDDVTLEDGARFIQDIVGLDAIDDATGERLGVVSDILPMPAGNVYEIRGERTILVPDVPEFIAGIDDSAVRFRLIEGM